MYVKIFNREPATLLAAVAVVVKLATAFGLGLSPDQQSVINAAAAALAGLIVALVAHDALSAPILGVAQAALSLALGFGLHWSADQQSVVMSAVAVAVAMFVRTQVTAPVPAVVVAAPVVTPVQPAPPAGPSAA
jgi:hypothetical protein